jgi:DNA polymerase III delta prime subunit
MDVLKSFHEAIEIEYNKTIQEFNEQEKLPIDERVAKGVLMTNLTVEFELESRHIILAKIFCENNISKFKEGTPVILSNGDISFKMDVDEDSVDNFILKPNDWDAQFCLLNSLDYPRTNWEICSIYTDIGTKMLKNTARHLECNEFDLIRVEKFLNGKTQNSYYPQVDGVKGLNDSQNRAFQNAVSASDFCLIQGPPGTGKTTTIASIAKQFIIEGKKVFVTAPTHTAINNCLDSISKTVNVKWRTIKIGEKANNKEIQSNDIVEKLSRLQHNRWLSILSDNNVTGNYGITVGATVYALCYPVSKKLEGWNFDVAIVDEASQLSIPLALAIISRVKKVIFVGDHKQLDPIIPKKSNNEMFAESIFSRLARLYPKEIHLLQTSYRLNEELIKLPNHLFYNDKLVAAETTIIDSQYYFSNDYSKILNNGSHTLVLHNTFDAQGRSPYEAKLVAGLISDLLSNGIKIEEIGIISPYRAQVREIKKAINKVLPKNIKKPFEKLFVDTVDSIQGQERNYIIYSFGNSHPLESMSRLDFFYSPNRLNVAITRAVKKCIVISNYKVFDIIDNELVEHEEYDDIKDSLEIFKKYRDLASVIEINEVDFSEW